MKDTEQTVSALLLERVWDKVMCASCIKCIAGGIKCELGGMSQWWRSGSAGVASEHDLSGMISLGVAWTSSQDRI